MCGILTYFKKSGLNQQDILESINSLQEIKHRGPDGEGIVIINSETGDYKIIKTKDTPQNTKTHWQLHEIEDNKYDILLGHRRLSILELSELGHQPMQDNMGNWIVFNGEIFNYIELRNELKQLGQEFKSDSDTEVILKSYSYWGVNCFNKFNGMWSIIIYDKNNKNLVVSNDRYKIKPLYYFNNNQKIIFVSEQKQILKFSNTVKTYNQEAINKYIQLNLLDTDNYTFFQELNRFPASNYSIINTQDNQIKLYVTQYYQVNVSANDITEQCASEKFREILENSIAIRMRTHVPYAFALSGGLDSSAVLYLAEKINKNKNVLNSFSAVFKGLYGDESYFMELIQKNLGLHANYVNPIDSFNIKNFEKHIYHQDAPVQSTSYYAEYALAELVRNSGYKVLLVGQGADEIFAGYHHHFYQYIKSLFINVNWFKLNNEIKSYARLKGISQRAIYSRLYNDLKKYYSNKNNNISKNKSWDKIKSLSDILLLDFNNDTLPLYLKSDDRDGMAFSIESRHPFLDHRMVDFAFSLPDNIKIADGWQKNIIRKSMTEMPYEIKFRKDKKGFTTPQNYWVDKFKNELTEIAATLPKEYNTNDVLRNASLAIWFKLNMLN